MNMDLINAIQSRILPRVLPRTGADVATLAQLIGGGGGGGSVDVSLVGESPLIVPYVSGGITDLCLYGKPITQSGTPTPSSPKPILVGGKELKYDETWGVPYVDDQDLVIKDADGNVIQSVPICLPIGNDSAWYIFGEDEDGAYYSWEVTRMNSVFVLNGEENIYHDGSRFVVNYTYNYQGVKPIVRANCYCNYFKYGNNGARNTMFANRPTNARYVNLYIYTASFGTDADAFKSWLAEAYNNGNPMMVIVPLESEGDDVPYIDLDEPIALNRPTSVLECDSASKIECYYEGQNKQWYEFVIGLNTDVDYSERTDVTSDALVSIISNANPTHAIVIKLSSADYAKCASGGEWYSAVSTALSSKPLVTIAQ